jgi:hypothetical protein
MVQDESGRWWVKSPKSGEWHYNDGTTWVKGIPPGGHSTPRAMLSTEERVSEYQPHVERQEAWWRQKEVLGAIAAAFAGATWIMLGFHRVGPPGYVHPLGFDGGVLLMEVGTLVGLVGLGIQQAASYRGLRTIGFLVAFISLACLLVYHAFLVFIGGPTTYSPPPAWLITLDNVLVLLEHIGFVLIGIAYLGARVVPPWVSIAFILGAGLLPVFDFGFAPGDKVLMPSAANCVFGCIWIVLGYALWPNPRAAPP